MIEIKEKAKCCGCTACFNVCPKRAISMRPDEEGFLYPLVDEEKCVKCDLCNRICPIMHPKTKEENTQGYVIRNKNADILFESTSGGAFTAFAEYVLHRQGVVYGAGYDRDMRVICKRATESEQLSEMRGSKFVQSTLGNIFQEVQADLHKGLLVLYTGTPCQIAGLLSYLGEKPDNLLCMDFVCRGVPSPELWRNYVAYMQKRYGSRMVGARFKHKTYGYHTSTMKVDFENGKTYFGSGRIDPYMKAFVREMSSRPSCADCSFKGAARPSDITMFDCYEYSRVTGKADDDQGWSSLLVHSDLGRSFFEEIKDSLQWSKADVGILIGNNGVMVKSSAKPHARRDEFYHLTATLPIDKAMDKIEPIAGKDMAIEKSKGFLYRTGLIKVVRKMRKKHRVEIVE